MERKLQVQSGPGLMVGVLQLECAMVLHEVLLVPVMLYGSETLW